MYRACEVFRSFQLALHERFIDDDFGRHICQFTPLPGFDLLSHRFEIPLHPVHTNRDAVDERERLRVFRQDWREHASDNVSKSARRILDLATPNYGSSGALRLTSESPIVRNLLKQPRPVTQITDISSLLDKHEAEGDWISAACHE
jgi:hypothetical protein